MKFYERNYSFARCASHAARSGASSQPRSASWRQLKAHELIKVRVPTDDREEREAIFVKIADELGCARVQMIGKLLVLWRPADEEEPTAEEWIARAAAAAKGLDKEAAAPAKKVAVKRPGDKKKKVEAQPRRRARPKTKRVTKKSALG